VLLGYLCQWQMKPTTRVCAACSGKLERAIPQQGCPLEHLEPLRSVCSPVASRSPSLSFAGRVSVVCSWLAGQVDTRTSSTCLAWDDLPVPEAEETDYAPGFVLYPTRDPDLEVKSHASDSDLDEEGKGTHVMLQKLERSNCAQDP
jgi:hypothetical protein